MFNFMHTSAGTATSATEKVRAASGGRAAAASKTTAATTAAAVALPRL